MYLQLDKRESSSINNNNITTTNDDNDVAKANRKQYSRIQRWTECIESGSYEAMAAALREVEVYYRCLLFI